MSLVDVIFAFCMSSSDEVLCYEKFVNCVITNEVVTKKKINQCKEKINNESKNSTANSSTT